MTQTQKHWLFSSIQTFLAGFVLAVVPFIYTLNIQTIDKAVVIGILLTGIRAGFKALGIMIAPNVPQA